MREDANDAAQNQLGHPEDRFGPHDFLKPSAKFSMIGGILTFRVHQYVNVD
jgi:hypothetical protein